MPINYFLFWSLFSIHILLGTIAYLKFFNKSKLFLFTAVPIAFCFNIGLLSITAYALEPFKLNFSIFYVIYFSVISAISVFLIIKRPLKIELRKLERPDKLLLILIAAALLLSTWSGGWYSNNADTFYHIAAIDSIDKNGETLVKNIFTDSKFSGIDPSSGTWHLFIAVFGKFSGLSATDVFDLFLGISLSFIILSFYNFSRILLKNKNIALLNVALFILLALKLDFRTINYPNQISYVFYFTNLYFLLKYLKSYNLKYLASIFLLSFSLLAVHIGFFELYIITLVIFAISAIVLLNANKKAILVMLLGHLALAPLLLVRISPLKSAKFLNSEEIVDQFGAVNKFFGLRYYDFANWIPDLSIGLALAIFFPLLIFLTTNKRTAAFLVPLSLFIPLFSLVSVIDINLVQKYEYHLARLANMLQFAMVSIMSIYVFLLIDKLNNIKNDDYKISNIMLSAFIFLGLLSFTIPEGPELKKLFDQESDSSILNSKRASIKRQWVSELAALAAIPKNKVIASDPVSSYYLAALSGHDIIAVPHGHAPVQLKANDQKDRIYNAYLIMQPRVSMRQTLYLLDKYSVDYIFINKTLNEKDPVRYSKNQREKFGNSTYFHNIFENYNSVIFEVKSGYKVRPSKFVIEAESFDNLIIKTLKPNKWKVSKKKSFFAGYGALTRTRARMQKSLGANKLPQNFILKIFVHNSATGKKNKISVKIGNQKRIIEWGNKKTIKESIEIPFADVGDAPNVQIHALELGQKKILIDRLEIIPSKTD